MSAKLNGVILSALAPVGWTHTIGVAPHIRGFEVSARTAAEIDERRDDQGVTLEIEPPGRKPYAVEELYILDIQPGSRQDTRKVVVADRRWTFKRKAIARDFNLRRRSGSSQLVGDARVEIQPTAADVVYASWSVDEDGKPFDLRRALESVLRTLAPNAYRIPDSISREILVEGLESAEGGDVALARLLSYAAGLNVWVDRRGVVRVLDTRDQSEKRAIEEGGQVLFDSGAHALVDRSFVRPARVYVHFEREAELRFDCVENETAWTIDRNSKRVPRKIENVLPIPDLSLVVGGRTVQRGTWVAMDDYLNAIAGQETTTQGASRGPLTHAIIRAHWLGMWSRLMDSYGRDTSGNTDRTWVRRLHAIRTHWRQTFRPLPQWRDKIRSLRAYRSSVIDSETGTRAPAQAWMDYVAKPSVAGLFKRESQNPNIGRQVAGWAERLANGEPAPALVSVLDEEAGIIRVSLVADPWGEAESLAPGNVAKLPTQKVRGDLSKKAVGAAYALLQYIELLATFRVAVVLTAVQAAPNGLGRYHHEEVSPDEAAHALGLPIGDCKGPVADVIISGGIVTARTAWVDDQAAGIEDAFYLGAAFPQGLCVNADEVRAQAVAQAAAFYANLLDRREGNFAVAWAPDFEPTGAIASVEHTLAPNGIASTRIVVQGGSEPPNPFAFVPASIQKITRRLVQP